MLHSCSKFHFDSFKTRITSSRFIYRSCHGSMGRRNLQIHFRHGYAKIYSQQQYPFGIIHFDPFKSRKENISFMDEKHVISLYEFSTQANEYYAYIGMRSSLKDDYKYETHIQISIFDVESETLLIIECAK